MSLLSRSLRGQYIARRLQQTQARAAPLQPISSIVQGPAFTNVVNCPNRVALRDKIAHYTYANLFVSARRLSEEISRLVKGRHNERIMFLCPNDANYVITLWAIWMSGQIAVPLSPLHPKNILLYYANDTNSSLLITTSEFSELMQRVSKNTQTPLHVLDDKMRLDCTHNAASGDSDLSTTLPPTFYDSSNAMILYTSGTTGQPKGVVLSHKNLNFQVQTLLDAWKWSANDTILHTLPLHHVHGIVNALLCPLHIGAKTIMLEKFNANIVWSYLLGLAKQKPDDRKVSVYMAVPTIYSKLIDEYEKVFRQDAKMAEYIKQALKTRLRLMVSGSAPLPAPLYKKWLEISGHDLLERYGMTEIGMCLSNLYDAQREPGYVGMPLPGVSVKLNNEGKDVLQCTNDGGHLRLGGLVPQGEDPTGELLVKSDGVFREYYKRPEATKAEFTEDGWFKTGDMCLFSRDKNKFKILGRKSVDIIKSGGYKISALHIETELLAHPDIKECAIIGLNDPQWGERIAAMVVLQKGKELTLDTLKDWGLEKLPKYSLPTVLKVVEAIPKNAMGKVNKKELAKMFF